MAKIKYRNITLGKTRLERLAVVNAIIEEYQAAGYVLTLRQLYYLLVSRAIIPNKQNEYKNLGNLLKEGRMGGIVDWDAIEDRIRQVNEPSSWSNPGAAMDAIIQQYQLPRTKAQPAYLEVWVEKDALSGVLSRITRHYHVPLLVTRGNSSTSAMFDSWQRFEWPMDGREVVVLYIGDFDPTGLDMIRDVNDRIREFAIGAGNRIDPDLFTIKPIALTQAQIQLYNPPTNPVKETDSRSAKFIELYGEDCYEVDALPPEVLNPLLVENIEAHLDMGLFNKMMDSEAADIDALKRIKKLI